MGPKKSSKDQKSEKLYHSQSNFISWEEIAFQSLEDLATIPWLTSILNRTSWDLLIKIIDIGLGFGWETSIREGTFRTRLI